MTDLPCAAAVTSPHPLACAAGAEVLRRGGNAAEAAIAMGAVLAVVMPHFCGLGGDAVFMLADRQGRSRALMAIGQAPQVLPDLPDIIATRGAGAMLTTACLVDGWAALLAYGRAHWSGRAGFDQLLAEAVRLAQEGYMPDASQDFWRDFRAHDWPDWPGFAAHFGDARGGALFRQPELAEMLALICADGPRSFYDGAAARRVAQGLAEAGAPLTAHDLAATHCQSAAPLSLSYRGATLLAPPPPTQGLTTLEIMGVLARFDLGAVPPGAARTHLIIEAVKQAFLDRALIADPSAMMVAPGDILAAAHLDARAGAIDRHRARPWPQPYQHGDTAFFAVSDQWGNAVSALQSTYFDWGSGVTVGDTGILWQNRGAAFSTRPGDANQIAPGKRPFYTLNPGIALQGGVPRLLYGTQGADGQPQTLAVLLSALIDEGLDAGRALAQPRFLLGRTFSDSRDSLKLEASVGDDVARALADMGHEVVQLPALSPIFGAAGCIRIEAGGGIDAGHDPRGEGCAICLDAQGDTR